MKDTAPGKKKVLYATFNSLPGPSGNACWSSEVLKELARYFQVDGLSIKTEDLSHIERLHQARLLRVPVGSGSFLQKVKAFQRALNRQMDSEEYECCHFTSIWEGMVLCSRKKADGYRLVYEVNSLPSVEFKSRYPSEARSVETSYSLKQQEERCFDLADVVIAGSESIRSHIVKRGVSTKKIVTVNPAVDLTTFDPASDEHGHAATILYLGSLQPWQGVIALLQTLAELPRNLRVRLVLLTPKNDPNLSEIKGKIQILGLSKSVEIRSEVEFDDLAQIVSKAAVCVAPLSNHERNRRAAAIPHKVLVYMAGRRPIVAARQPAINGMLENNRTAILYAPGHSDGLSDAIKRLLLDREFALQLGNQARLYLEENLSLEKSQRKIREVYRQLIGEPRPSVPKTNDDSTDTKPSMVAKKPRSPKTATSQNTPIFPAASDTAKVSMYTDKEVVRDFLSDTQKETSSPDVEMIFYSAQEADTSPEIIAGDTDAWQVIAAREINLSKIDTKPAIHKNGNDTNTKQKRFLLGGPSYPLEAEKQEQALLPESQSQTTPSTPLVLAKNDAKKKPPPLPKKNHPKTNRDN